MPDSRSLSLARPASDSDDGPGRRGPLVPLGSEPAETRCGRQAPAVTVREVGWHHLAAVALREALAAEMLLRSAAWPAEVAGETPAAVAGAVAYTGVAFNTEGLPVGHAALRWNDDDVELQRVYITPPYRGSGTAAALLAAAEEAARELQARRIILRAGDEQPDAAGVWEQAGYTRVPHHSPTVPPHFEKLITGYLPG
jgi:GNAT superfamily N-acetyltransferase